MIGFMRNPSAAPWAVDGLIHGRFEWGDVPEFRGHAPRQTHASAWVWLDLATTPGLEPIEALESIGIYPDRQLPRLAAARLAELGKLALRRLGGDARGEVIEEATEADARFGRSCPGGSS